ncbi:MAG TPA: hypothetical protein VMF12_07250 [Xanthobacteraceae bacterium]|nr:hypothetical protein [Xanthobacteraceae bacterium]
MESADQVSADVRAGRDGPASIRGPKKKSFFRESGASNPTGARVWTDGHGYLGVEKIEVARQTRQSRLIQSGLIY